MMDVPWVRNHRKSRSKRLPSSDPYHYGDKTNTKRIYLVEGGKKARYVKIGRRYVLKPLNWSKPDESRQLPSRTLHFPQKRTVPWSKGGCPYQLRSFLSHQSQQLLQEHKEPRYLLSSVGDFDEVSEASREKYATIALNEFNSFPNLNSKHKGSFHFVESGPIALGYSSSAGRILHLNFKARDSAAPGASVQTFFTELTKTNRNVVSVVSIHCLGPSSSLPEKANTFGCVYCSSHNIHHPDSILFAFHNGREDHWTTLESHTNKLQDFIWQSEEEGFRPKFSHPGVKYFDEEFEVTPSVFATVALSLFNSGKKGANFELVNCCSYGQRLTSVGLLSHINFKAKNKGDPDAPLQTFFAEVITISRHCVFAVFCECLGPSDSILPEETNFHGCTFCNLGWVIHPPGPGYLNGR